MTQTINVSFLQLGVSTKEESPWGSFWMSTHYLFTVFNKGVRENKGCRVFLTIHWCVETQSQLTRNSSGCFPMFPQSQPLPIAKGMGFNQGSPKHPNLLVKESHIEWTEDRRHGVPTPWVRFGKYTRPGRDLTNSRYSNYPWTIHSKGRTQKNRSLYPQNPWGGGDP